MFYSFWNKKVLGMTWIVFWIHDPVSVCDC